MRIEHGQRRDPKGIRVAVVTALALSLIRAPAWGYEEADVTRGGTLTGRVTLKGDAAPARAFNLVTFPDPVYRRNDLIDNPHFGLEAKGKALEIEPSLEQQVP